MNIEYKIDNDYLKENFGLDLCEYALDTTFVPMLLNIAFEKVITRILFLNDNFSYESDIELALDENENLIAPFKKLQFQVVYNLVFLGDSDPIDFQVDAIICSDLKWGKLNGWQKQVYRR